MARRMYDLDNGTENIKVKSVETDSIFWRDEFAYSVGVDDKIIFNKTGAFFMVSAYFPPYITADRPISQGEGAVIYDSTLKKCILWNGTAWVNLDGTALS